MAPAKLNMVKLCVGVETPQELIDWQNHRRRETGRSHAFHVTRMWPKRGDDLLDGGSLYWVMKGFIKARQRILALEPRQGEDGIKRCAIILDENMVNVELTPRRAFQGWRYLQIDQTPPDLAHNSTDDSAIPDELAYELARLGVR